MSLFRPTREEVAEGLAALEEYQNDSHPANRFWRACAGTLLIMTGLALLLG